MNLYLVRTVNGLSSYVISNDLNAAWEKMIKRMDADEYGTYDMRKLKDIRLVACTDTYGYPHESSSEQMKLIM